MFVYIEAMWNNESNYRGEMYRRGRNDACYGLNKLDHVELVNSLSKTSEGHRSKGSYSRNSLTLSDLTYMTYHEAIYQAGTYTSNRHRS